MNAPLVTIITPAYNQERHIAACVESALAQTYPNWEQVVIDDGSSDRTREVVASYDDPRIRMVALPHRGLRFLADSYNQALACSNGALVGVLEGDDRWPADKLARQVPLFEDPATVLTWGRGQLIDDDGVVTGTRTAVRGARGARAFPCDVAFRRLTRVNFMAPSVSVMVRRSALDAIGGFHQEGTELFVDLPTWLWVTATSTGQVVFSDEILGIYRVHARQTTALQRTEMTRGHWRAVEQVVEALPPQALARAGWTEDVKRRARARAILSEGESALLARDRRAAVTAFRRALAEAPDLGDRLFALLGITSALIGVDLIERAFAARDRIAG